MLDWLFRQSNSFKYGDYAVVLDDGSFWCVPASQFAEHYDVIG